MTSEPNHSETPNSSSRLGPVLVTPEPYWSCEGCRHRCYDLMPNGAFTYQRWYCRLEQRELDRFNLTPAWCPLLPKGQTDD